MTMQPPPPAAPTTHPDLRQQHERVQKQFRTARVVALCGIFVLALVVALVPLLSQPGPDGLIVGAIIFIAILALFGGMVLLSQNRERSRSGPAGHGPSSFGQVVTSAPGPQVWEAINGALAEVKFAPGRPIDWQTVVSSRSLSMSSWGETLTIRIVGTADGRGLVTAWSRPANPLQWLDYGRNRKFANTILNAIPAATPVA